MSIRKRDVHFSDWTKVRHALVCNNVQGITETSSLDEVRAFLINSESGSNPFYYYVCYFKETNEIYTHGRFYGGSKTSYDDTELRDLIGTKADLSALEALVSEVEANEEVTAAALTELHENKADKSEIPDVSTFATKDELNTLSAEVEEKVDSATFTTLSETVAGHTTNINNLSNNKADKIDLENYAEKNVLNTKQDQLVSGINIKTVNDNTILGSGNIETPDTKVTSAGNHYKPETHFTKSGITTGIKYDEKGHITEVETRSLTSSDIPDIDASKITSGTISIDRLPHGALERLYILTNRQAAIEHSEVSEGDTIMLVDENNTMYFCVNNNGITFDEKFRVYTAAAATRVSWEGITGKPDLVTQDELNVVKEEYLPLSGGTVNGNIAANDFITTSDERLKDFESDVNIDFDKLKSIPKKYYYWKDKSMGDDLQMGTSAQALAKIYPECVNYDEVSDRYSVNYQKLSIVALAAIDKLYDRISELESKLYD